MAKVINELSFTKELIKIPSVTPIDAGGNQPCCKTT